MAQVLVIAVEEPGKILVEQSISGHKFAQNERLKEPGSVGEVPLHWRGFGQGLHHHVLWCQRLAQLQCPSACLPKSGADFNFRANSSCRAHGIPSSLKMSVSRTRPLFDILTDQPGRDKFACDLFLFWWSNNQWPKDRQRRIASFVRIPSMRREYVELEGTSFYRGFCNSGSPHSEVLHGICSSPQPADRPACGHCR